MEDAVNPEPVAIWQTVRTRRVFYVPGFDPMPPRRYRELYRKEGAKQAALSGYSLHLEAGDGEGTYNWDVSAEIDGQKTRTRFEFFRWDDLVRGAMDTPIPRSFLQLGTTLWLYLRSGALRALFGMRPGPMLAAFYPVLMLPAQLAMSLFVAALIYSAFAPLSVALAAPSAIAALAALMVFFRRLDSRLYVYYLLHDFVYFASYAGATPPGLRHRMALFEERLLLALNSDADEVLIVGHSTGAQTAVQLAASVLRKAGPDRELSLLTLGQAIPMVAFLPGADELRRDLHYLSNHKQLAWADVSAPGDGASFALCDPVQVTGVAAKDACWPITISAAFSQTLSKKTLRRHRWRYFRRHFQYLCAFEHPRDYEYFRITAGPDSLRALLSGRKNSPSRITAARSPYRDMAP